MRRIFKKSIPTKRVVFRATIELNSEYRERFNPNSNYYDDFNRLNPKNRYYFGKNEKKVTYEELKDVLTGTLETELLPL